MTQPSIWEFMEGVFLMDKTESKKQIKYLKKKKQIIRENISDLLKNDT